MVAFSCFFAGHDLPNFLLDASLCIVCCWVLSILYIYIYIKYIELCSWMCLNYLNSFILLGLAIKYLSGSVV